MTDVVSLGERKGTAKCEPRMPLSGKEREEIVKIYCLNGQNAAQKCVFTAEIMDYDEARALSKLYGT